MEALARVSALQWFAVPTAAVLLSGRPVVMAAVTVALYASWALLVLLRPVVPGADPNAEYWLLLSRALYVAAALVVALPAVLASAARRRWVYGAIGKRAPPRAPDSSLHAHSWCGVSSWGALALVLLGVAFCFARGIWGELSAPPLPGWDWQAPVGRLSSITLFLGLALSVRHLQALDAGVTVLWIATTVLAALSPNGWLTLALVAGGTVAFLLASTVQGGTW